jgi:hypothetical protein
VNPYRFKIVQPRKYFQNVPSIARVAAGAFGFLTLINVSRRSRPVNRGEALEHDAFQSQIAHGLKQFFAVACGVFNVLNAIPRTDQEFAENAQATAR